MKKLICKLLGHQWWKLPHVWTGGVDMDRCARCGKVEKTK